MIRLTLGLLLTSFAAADALKVLSIGDSLTEEYAFELPFTAPDSEPTDANVRNWPELFRIYRSGEATLGPYEGTAGSYTDLRDGGHRFNFGIPGFTTQNWENLINTENTLDEFNWDSGSDPLRFSYEETRNALTIEMTNNTPDVVVIFVGGNDLKQSYDKLYADTEPAGFFDAILQNIQYIHSFVRSYLPNTPIVVATIPDVGATPNIYTVYNDPTTAAATRTKIAGYNSQIVSTFDALTNTTVARVDRLTDLVYDRVPFHINGSVFTIEGDPENPPDHLFCKDDFHPATAAQALVTNELIEAINAQLPGSITPFPNRSILSLTGLNPDQPYLDWASSYSLSDSSKSGDDDMDKIPNLAEMALGTSPTSFNSPTTGNWPSGISWTPDPVALRYANLLAEESANLNNWTLVPESRLLNNSGTITATPEPGIDSSFVRLRAAVRP